MFKQTLNILLALLLCFNTVAFAQKVPSKRPKLVVFIMVNQLNTHQLVAFKDQLSDNGLKRLINGGTYYRNASYPAGSTYYGSNLATIYTGAYASTHGIVSDWWYDHLRGKEVSAAYGDLILNEDDKSHYPTTDRLLTSTLTDELQWINNRTSKVGAIGFNSNYLIWTGGHNPDHLFMINDDTGAFSVANKSDTISSLLDWVVDFNDKELLQMYSKRSWGPLNNLNRYYQMKYFSEQRGESNAFMYSLEPQEGKGAYIPVVHSPFGNTLIHDFAMSLIVNEEYGKDEATDVLTLHFTTRSVHGDKSGAFDAETEDMILRLDMEIASLLKKIDKEVGLENTLVVTTSVDAPARSMEENNDHHIPTGVFNGNKASSLLNLFLMAKYGQGKWVMTYHDVQIYLNRDLIKKQKLDIRIIEQEAAHFLRDMEGVAFAIPVSELQNLPSDITSLRSLKLNYHPIRSGDIVLKIQPGWVEELEDGRKINRSWSATHMPLIFYGWKIKHQEVYESVPMINVAPTISSFLEIPFPNGSEGTTLKGLID